MKTELLKYPDQVLIPKNNKNIPEIRLESEALNVVIVNFMASENR